MTVAERPYYSGPDRASQRDVRLSGRRTIGDEDTRTQAQRDKDRITYSTAWRRLVAVTQVVTPFEDLPLLHNRLTHSEKVAQVARSIAENLLVLANRDQKSPRAAALQTLGGYDADVCEAAALAHDLGHPPFGHVGEQVLDKAARTILGLRDGFEGNAQTMRIVSIGRVRSQKYEGLDLTMATLAGIAKYPWIRAQQPLVDGRESEERLDEQLAADPGFAKRWRKFNFYDSEADLLDSCRAFVPDTLGGPAGSPEDTQTLEASTMDIADDITYAVHDLEDSYIGRILDMDAVLSDLRLAIRNVHSYTSFDKLRTRLAFDYQEFFSGEDYDEALQEVVKHLERYFSRAMRSDTEAESFARQGGSVLVGRYIAAVDISEEPLWQGGPHIGLKPQEWHEVQVLKEIARSYVIRRPDIALLQIGQQSIIESLVTMLNDWAENDRDRLPQRLRYELEIAEAQANGMIGFPVGYGHDEHAPRGNPKRAILDFLCTLGDSQCASFYYKLSGLQFNRVGDGLGY